MECGMFSETHRADYFWTAGQRIDPSNNSTFVWRITSNTFSDTVSAMTYTNWGPNEPNYVGGEEHCMQIWAAVYYLWNDVSCSDKISSVCELDI